MNKKALGILNAVFCAWIVLFFAIGCGDGDDAEAESTDTDSLIGDTGSGIDTTSTDSESDATDTDTVPDVDVADVITHATPRVPSMILEQVHSGWKNPACLDCHQNTHTSGYDSVDKCATCHGSNGAGLMPTDHSFKGCVGCHGSQHSALELTDDNQCRSCHLAYNENKMTACADTGHYDVIIVGAGGGGLAAASVLTEAKKKVLVLEQHYKAGGAMVTFDRADYTIEASLHAYDGLSLGNLNELGIGDELVSHAGTYMYRSVYPDFSLDIPADPGAYRDALKQQFPTYADQLDNLFAVLMSMDIFSYEDQSVSDLMEAHGIDDLKLITVLTQLVGFIGAPLDQINASLYIGMWGSFHVLGYYYFEGGSQSITDAMTAKVLKNGGEILLNTLVTKINIADGLATGVETANGGCYTADYVLSNANEPDTYLKLIGEEHLPEELIAEMSERDYAPPVSLVYLGVNHDYTDAFPEGAHEIWVNSTYADEWFAEGPQCEPEQGISIANYSILDPTAAPSGKNVIALTFLIDYECDKQWQMGISYDEYKAYKTNLAEYYIDFAEEFLPGLKKYIEVVEVASPTTVERYTLNPEGSWAGWDLQPEETALSLMAEDKHLTPFPNLYVAGSWATTGGQSTVVKSGMIAANLILKAAATE